MGRGLLEALRVCLLFRFFLKLESCFKGERGFSSLMKAKPW